MQHGLPTSAITAIAQDADGYLWLGSFAGLIRFDGVRFVRWSTIGSPALPESLIHVLTAARDGSLWIGFGNMGGVGRIQGETLRVYPSGQGLPDGSIQTIVEDDGGTIWAGGPGGVARLRGERWERVEGAPGVAQLFVGRGGNVFATSREGVFRWHRDAGAPQLVDANRRTVDIAEDAAGALWTTGQPLLRPLDSRSAGAAGGDGTNGYRLLRDRRNHLWIATLGQGLVHVRSSRWSDEATRERVTQQQGLTSDRILSLFEDVEGNIWVGTSVGLNRLSAHIGGDPVASLPEFDGHNVRALAVAADRTVWTGTDNGLNRLSQGRSRWFREADGLPSGVVRALHAAPDGRLWVATDQGPAVFEDGRFAPLRGPDGLTLNQISAITTDADGHPWMFDARGVYRWRMARQPWSPLRPRRATVAFRLR
jgi:ligand-binding sensor domain-containing protein